MRDETDIIPFRVTLTSAGSLDLERLEADPIWASICRSVSPLGSPGLDALQFRVAIKRYLGYYMKQDQVLTNNPATNGPPTPIQIGVEVLKRGEKTPLEFEFSQDKDELELDKLTREEVYDNGKSSGL